MTVDRFKLKFFMLSRNCIYKLILENSKLSLEKNCILNSNYACSTWYTGMPYRKRGPIVRKKEYELYSIPENDTFYVVTLHGLSSIMRRNTSYLENPVALQILNFIHPHLYRLISRELTLLGGNQPGNILPVSLLITLGSIETLESYKIVLLGYKFNCQAILCFRCCFFGQL